MYVINIWMFAVPTLPGHLLQSLAFIIHLMHLPTKFVRTRMYILERYFHVCCSIVRVPTSIFEDLCILSKNI